MKFVIVIVFVFSLIACGKDPVPPTPEVPSVNTLSPVSNITYSAAKVRGIVISSGRSVITERGICWSTTSTPTILSSKTSDAGGEGEYICDLTNLLPGTTYYVRAFATNAVGTDYGSQITFTTLYLPVISTSNTSSISTNSATSGGSVSSSGSSSVTARGVCWNTSPSPTVSLSTKTFNGAGTGSFTSSITGLASRTTYYVRAYATNAGGTSYGANVSFTTN